MFNELAPLCVKQTEYIKKTQTSWLNVAHGGKRGGKNVTNGLAFCIALENHPDKLHLISGYDTSSAKLNILDCDGYGVLNYFAGRCKEGKYKNREQAFAKKQAEDTKTMRIAYQKELDSRIDDCEEQVAQGLSENWLKLTALMGLTLKRKYNWSNGRISAFIEKSNEMHLDMLKSGEWDNILKLLDEECDVQLEVGD